MPKYANLTPGDPAPWFHQRSFANPQYAIDTAAGRYIVLCFFASADEPHSRAALAAVLGRRDLFDDAKMSFFGVSVDPKDESEKRIADSYPGYRFLFDFNGAAGRLYGAVPVDAKSGGIAVRRLWVVLDPTLRVLKIVPFAPDRSDIAEVVSYVENLPPAAQFAGIELQAPILLLPNVFEPEFCRKLIGLYEAHGGEESGFMREVGGKTVSVHDHRHKRRRDYLIEDPELIKETQTRFQRRVVPEILKVHQFKITRMERYIVRATRRRTRHTSAPIATTPRRGRRIAGSPSRSISTTISTAAKSASRNTDRAASSRRPVGPWCSHARCCMRCPR